MIDNIGSFLAQVPGSLIPCGNGIPCNICHIWVLADNLIRFILLTIATPLMIIVLLWGGFLFLTSGGDPKKIEQGKKLITSAIFGVIIAFSAWLIVNTVITTIVKDNFEIKWNAIRGTDCPLPIEPDIEALREAIRRGEQLPTTDTGLFGTEAQAQTFFRDAGIEVRSTRNCSSNLTEGCTSLIGYPVGAATWLLEMYKTVPFAITGGTEVGHATHGIGKSQIDLKPLDPTQRNYDALRNQINILAPGAARCEKTGGQEVRNCGAETTHVHAQMPTTYNPNYQPRQ